MQSEPGADCLVCLLMKRTRPAQTSARGYAPHRENARLDAKGVASSQRVPRGNSSTRAVAGHPLLARPYARSREFGEDPVQDPGQGQEHSGSGQDSTPGGWRSDTGS